MIRLMPFKLSAILSITAAIFKDRADLVAENWAAIFTRYNSSRKRCEEIQTLSQEKREAA